MGSEMCIRDSICPAEITEINGIDYNNLPENFLPNQLAWCFDAVMRSEAVAVLPAWGKSVGARAEVLIATMTGKPVYAYHQFRPEVLEPLTNINIVTRAEMIARA